MKILIKENCFANGKPFTAGDVTDQLSDNDVAVLRSMGLATADKALIAAAEDAAATPAPKKKAASKATAETAAV